MKSLRIFASVAALCTAGSAFATDLEVTHWWTSGGEAAAVAELAKAFNATGNNWVDAAIAGSGTTARPIMISRITGGDPMGATQFNHGRQAEELVEAGLMRDLEDIATADKWREIIKPASLLESCIYEGKVYCAPVNVHSAQWLWLSNKAFEEAGVPIPKDWNEFVAAAPALKKAGKIPLAMGKQPWQQFLVIRILTLSLGGTDLFLAVFDKKDPEAAASEAMRKVFEAAADAREMSADSNVQDWNQATNLIITDQAGGQLMGDWARGEFQVAGKVAGKDYSCLPGLGLNQTLATNGDAFYFPLVNDEETAAAQVELARAILSPETQVAFNLKKGSLPVRGDVDLEAADECMSKGLKIVGAGSLVPSINQLITPDTLSQSTDLLGEFFANPSMTPEEVQARFVKIIEDAE